MYAMEPIQTPFKSLRVDNYRHLKGALKPTQKLILSKEMLTAIFKKMCF